MEQLRKRLRQTEIMTEEAFEAQMEADAQIDADFRNLEALGRCNSSIHSNEVHNIYIKKIYIYISTYI